ncbi:D-alanyl-D-alanine carboxypeptidase / D-alanyl-D-alanine-endopeptidase (penicillin-binding protein 4) [Auraticoccus monumenti]|uniref:D-alanyl-D-alanine carboxypeptidase / D-alanyl-D-alanine-endopeptidase (Penicillin-binding protein 4) n=1 Tax=Auraticoccus monumenti TaxID=675864 RepID=A0A1G6RTE6_9ACTN|nr:D-alanyl-D-alanine carboxypeptidase / D-alanyl-D-alanine-endopeptidase (penicillin-binding protein 4) [Auraticoccus monumenti]
MVVGVVAGSSVAWGRPALYATGLLVDGGSPTVDPDVLRPPQPEPAPPGAPTLLPTAEEGEVPSPEALAERLRAVSRSGIGGRFDLSVVDAAGGAELYREGGGPSIPASTQKILTGVAVLHELGADHRFTTSVERRGARWVLVGGGDPLLTGDTVGGYPARGSLEQLAQQTSEAVEEAGVTEVDLGLDTDLFAGPAWSPDWPENYRDQVTPVSALVVDQGRLAGVSPGPREDRPARAALDRFAELLEDQGVEVGDVDDRSADGSGTTVAEVPSAPVGVLVERMLMTSDNDVAEFLLRHAALAAGEPASFEGGEAVVGAVLDELGIDDEGRRTRDGSGLSRENRLSSETLTAVVGLALSEEGAALRPLVTGLPVAGAVGSLSGRFTDPDSGAGLGEVRAKTGSLRQTNSLAGYTRTADGRLVAFALLVNEAENDYAARVWLDRAASAVSSCGC